MAAYAALAFLSLLWGSSFLLIKIAASAFDPFALALARGGVAAGTLIIAVALTGRIWPGRRPGLWARLVALSWIGQVIPFLLLGKAAQLTTSADLALMMGSAPMFVFLAGRFVGSGDRWTPPGRAWSRARLRWRGARAVVAGDADGKRRQSFRRAGDRAHGDLRLCDGRAHLR